MEEMTVQEAIKHCEEKAKEKYTEGMLCHANPNDDLLDGCIKCAKEHEQLAEWLKELEQYRALGTVEELKEAREKQIPKKPINKELKKYSGGTQVLFADCPMCEQPVKIYNGHQNNKEFRRDEDVYCNHCGQALDWSDENERD